MGNIKGKEGGSYRFSHKGWLVTLAGLAIAVSTGGRLERRGTACSLCNILLFISLFLGQKQNFQMSVSWYYRDCSSWVDYWISNVKPYEWASCSCPLPSITHQEHRPWGSVIPTPHWGDRVPAPHPPPRSFQEQKSQWNPTNGAESSLLLENR